MYKDMYFYYIVTKQVTTLIIKMRICNANFLRGNKGSSYYKYTRRGPTLCKGKGGYARYHLSDEPKGQNLLA